MTLRSERIAVASLHVGEHPTNLGSRIGPPISTSRRHLAAWAGLGDAVTGTVARVGLPMRFVDDNPIQGFPLSSGPAVDGGEASSDLLVGSLAPVSLRRSDARVRAGGRVWFGGLWRLGCLWGGEDAVEFGCGGSSGVSDDQEGGDDREA